MTRVHKIVLACSALAPIAFSTPALAVQDVQLRGSILTDQADGAALKAKTPTSNGPVRSLAFAAPHDGANSVMYLAPALASPYYNKTAKQIATSMGFLGNANGAGVIIGIVDTGIQLSHPEFKTATGASRVLPGTCLPGFSTTLCATADNKLGGDDLVWPVVTHGTHVAGIAAGTNVGLASAASLLPVRVCDSKTGSCPGDIDGGIVWASQHGAKIINLSLGGPFLGSRDVVAAQTAVANGSLLVVAAGNAGHIPVSGFLGGAALFNGIRGSMIVVGALDATNHIASFSQEPSTTCQVQSGATYCMQNYFVVAPGYQVISSVGGSKTAALSGTSMATPYVSGVAALIKGLWPYLSMSQVANVIFGTAIDLGAPGPDPVYGMGEVDAATALKPAGTTSIVTGGTTIASVAAGIASTPAGKSAPGIKSVSNASMTGALSAGISQSALLKNVVVVDGFGRDYSADLTKGVQNSGFDISSFLMLNQLLSVASAPGTVETGMQAVSTSAYSPTFGLVTMSGLVDSVTTPAVFGSGDTARDVVRGSVSNLAVSASPISGVSLDLGYKLRLSGRINEYDASSSAAYSGLFVSASAVNSPYASLTDGGNYVGTTINVADGLDVRTAFTWMTPNRQDAGLTTTNQWAAYANHAQQSVFEERAANAAVMSVSWRFADWGGLGLVASQTEEQNGVLGGVGSGALDVAHSASTSAIDGSLRVALSDKWMATASYGEGLTHLTLQPQGLLDSASRLRSRSYGIAIATRDVLGDDALGIALTRPMHVFSGSATVGVATAVDNAGNLTISHGQVAFAENTPETDLELGYTKSFMGGKLSLQSDAAYQMDVDGQTGQNAASFVTRLNLSL